MTTTKRIFWIAVIVALGLFAYSFLGAKGTIVLTSPSDNTVVYLDGVKYRTLKAGEIVTIKAEPGTHSVLTSKEGLFPWNKEIVLENGENIHLEPFMLSANPSGEIITGADPEYDKIVSLVKKAPLPISEARLKSAAGNVEIWAVGNAIFASWIGDVKSAPEYYCTKDPCDPIVEVFKGAQSIENLDFYNSREDILIFAAGNGVFAIETDPRGIKNFQPVFTGNKPQFLKHNEHTLYVLDGENLAEVFI